VFVDLRRAAEGLDRPEELVLRVVEIDHPLFELEGPVQDPAEQIDEPVLGEQAAHLARELGEGRQAPIEARERGALALESFVGPRVLKGGRGLRGDAGGQADLILRVDAIRRCLGRREQTQHLVLIDHRHPELAGVAPAPQIVTGLRGKVAIGGPHDDDPAFVDTPGEEGIVAQVVAAGPVVCLQRRVGVVGHELHRTALGVVVVDLGAGRAQSPAEALRDGDQHGVLVDRRAQRRRDAEERGKLCVAPRGLLECPGVVDGDRGLGGDRLGEADLVGCEAPRVARLGDVEHAEHLVAVDERHGEGGLLAPGRHMGEVVERESGVVVVHGLRTSRAHRGVAVGPRVGRKAPTQPTGVGGHAGHLVEGNHLELVTVGVIVVDVRPGRAERLDEPFVDGREGRAQVDARRDRRPGLEQQAQLPVLGVEAVDDAGAFDGDSGLGGQPRGKGLVGLGEAARVAPLYSAEKTDDQGPGDDRHVHDGALAARHHLGSLLGGELEIVVVGRGDAAFGGGSGARPDVAQAVDRPGPLAGSVVGPLVAGDDLDRPRRLLADEHVAVLDLEALGEALRDVDERAFDRPPSGDAAALTTTFAFGRRLGRRTVLGEGL
jgi:hypothetical protein